MEIISLRKRVAELETEMKTFKEDIENRWNEAEAFLSKFEGGKKLIKKVKGD